MGQRLQMIKLNVLEKNVRSRLVVAGSVLIGVLFAMGAFFQPLAKAVSNSEVLTAEEDKPVSTEPRIIVAMKTSMYDQVADDEDIDIMAKWINEGAKNDEFFKKKIYKIIKNDCVNCHSTSSTMTKKVPYIPFASYEDVKPFTKVGPTDASCL